jgi:ribosome-associated protein
LTGEVRPFFVLNILWRLHLNTIEITRLVIEALEEKKAENIVLIDIHEIASFTDYFVICSGSSDRMIDSLADAVLEAAKHKADLLGKKEGQASSGWVLVDLGDIVVHLFSPDQRDYYRLEQLWEKGKILLHVQ